MSDLATLTVDEAQMLLNDYVGDVVGVRLQRVSCEDESFPLLEMVGELRSAPAEFLRVDGVPVGEQSTNRRLYWVGEIHHKLDLGQLIAAPLTITKEAHGLRVWLSEDVFLGVTRWFTPGEHDITPEQTERLAEWLMDTDLPPDQIAGVFADADQLRAILDDDDDDGEEER